MIRLPFFLWLFIVTLSSLTLSLSAGANTRYLITQAGASDCGPTALATLLHYYLDVPTTEEEMIRLTKPHPETGTSFLGLEQAAVAKGCAADGFRMSYETLQEQLTTYPTPVIVRTLNPEPHFSVLLAVGKDYVYLADPALGNTLLRKHVFLRQWYIPKTEEGFVFIVTGPDSQVNEKRRSHVLQELDRQLHGLKSIRLPFALPR
jgi:hypothetical protein